MIQGVVTAHQSHRHCCNRSGIKDPDLFATHTPGGSLWIQDAAGDADAIQIQIQAGVAPSEAADALVLIRVVCVPSSLAGDAGRQEGGGPSLAGGEAACGSLDGHFPG